LKSNLEQTEHDIPVRPGSLAE